MEMNEWINNSLPTIINELEKNILEGFHVQSEEGLNITGRNAVYEVLDDILSVLFPGAYSKDKVLRDELNFFIGDTLRHLTYKLRKRIREIFEYHCIKDKCDECD